MDAGEYLKDPCAASSLPFWKTRSVEIPDNVFILRDDQFHPGECGGHGEPYFRMRHDLQRIPACCPAPGFEVVECNVADYAEHINECYDQERVSIDELKAYAAHPVYDSSLWIGVSEKGTHRIVATGIAELDTGIAEGILEWIQVSPSFRRQGLGRYVVCELLRRMQGRAQFATVSGRMNNADNPYALYLSCGFGNPVIWHVITSKELTRLTSAYYNKNAP